MTQRLPNPLKSDPSRTRSLVGRFFRNPLVFKRPQAQLEQRITEWITVKLDPTSMDFSSIISNKALETSTQILNQFEEYLLKLYEDVYERDEIELAWQRFIQEGYEKGAARAYDDAMKNKKLQASLNDKLPFYMGTRYGFLSSSFNQPISQERVEALVSRTFSELKGFQEGERNALRQLLADGLVKGDNPKIVAKTLTQKLDINKSRAETIARTELNRAHAEGQILVLEKLGISELGVEVEWTVSGNACPRCLEQAKKHRAVPIEKSRGLIPHHPNCRCCWIPLVPLS